MDPRSLFDCQVKRIHEYKRQLLNVLHVTDLYNRIKADPQAGVPSPHRDLRGQGGSRLCHGQADHPPDQRGRPKRSTTTRRCGGRLKVVFLRELRRVSLAERIIPAADLSEQISTAGTEASGTGNMKFALNGALTIGTLDGANVEIRDEVGADNFFLFGLTAEQVAERKKGAPGPSEMSGVGPRLRQVLELIGGGGVSPDQPDLFAPVVRALLEGGDPYMLLADFDSYVECQDRVAAAYRDEEGWTRTSILNVARMGWSSSDRAIREYAQQVWGVSATPVEMEAGKP